VNAPTLRAVSSYLNTATIHLTSCDYSEVLKTLTKGTFVYLDPPYDPVSDTSSFTGYSKGGFTQDDQIRLRECCDALNKKEIKFMLSNSATDFIKKQYAAYHITIVQAKRTVNSDSTKRGEVDEVVVRNYV
jgi:DNA adenine methylase